MAGELPITHLADLGDWLHEPWQICLPGVERLIKASVGIGAMSIYHPRSRHMLCSGGHHHVMGQGTKSETYGW